MSFFHQYHQPNAPDHFSDGDSDLDLPLDDLDPASTQSYALGQTRVSRQNLSNSFEDSRHGTIAHVAIDGRSIRTDEAAAGPAASSDAFHTRNSVRGRPTSPPALVVDGDERDRRKL
ncbi:hypothetical protein MRB53_038708 [Persea americana]|nr:hypothetical protein MRB53_038708 [Persea americana]